MRRVFTFLAAAMLASSAFAASVSKPAPSFSGVDVISSKEISLAQFKGKTVVLEWNNFDCPFVKKFYGSDTMQKLQAAAVKDGVVWITVNSSAAGKEGYLADAAAAKTAIAAHKSNASHYLLDPTGVIGKLYGAKTTPHMFVIDAKGTLVYAGAMDDKPSTDAADIAGATNYVSAALADLKAGRPVQTPATQAYGCFVKY